MFKTLIGKGHQEFSTSKQQDALEFIQHLFTNMERKEKSQNNNPYDPSTV
jgi:ubiquitin carboxyl-terminal hydrolase 5/13